jgi:Holliday junction resolvasome RuvABC endonuclease subunit
MTSRPSIARRVLAVDPCSSGFGFAVLEGSERLLDWGVREVVRRSDARYAKLIDDLIRHYQPDVIVVEECADRASRRGPRVRRLIQRIHKLGVSRMTSVRGVSRSAVQKAFSEWGGRTKQQIATTIANQLPQLASRLPPLRQPWMSEDYRMSIFDAVALGLTYFHLLHRRSSSPDRVKPVTDQNP